MDIKNQSEVEAALTAGKGVFIGSPVFLLPDGSTRDLTNCELSKPREDFEGMYAEFAGFTPASDANLNVLALSSFIKPLVAVTNPAPAVTDLAVGVQYFNSTEKKLKVLTAGTPNAWADADPNITAGGYIWYVPSGASAGMYRFVTDTLVKL